MGTARRHRHRRPAAWASGGATGNGGVGREAEVAAILDAFKRVAAGEGREVILISGEAGLGKTTVVAEAARVAFDGDGCVLFGHCEQGLATPYQLFAEALGHFVTHAPEEQLVAHVEAHRSELARLAPALSSRLPGLPPSTATDADTERYQLFAAVVGLLVTASQHQPLLVVLDDLQWADPASLQLLRHVIASDQPMRLLVVGIHRDSELSRAHPLLDTLADRGGDIATGLEGQETRGLLAAAINSLSEREKIVVTLYYFEGLTLNEIGEILGVTESRICQIHTKAVGQLRLQLVETE